MAFSITDFPEPVAPAMSKWGISVRSARIGWPAISLPRATTSGPVVRWYSSDASISLIWTSAVFWFGTSIPTADLPGMGASMRTLGAASASAISLVRLLIFWTRTPGAGWTSNRVTTGPCSQRVTLASTPKLARVCSNCLASSAGSVLAFPRVVGRSASSDAGGS